MDLSLIALCAAGALGLTVRRSAERYSVFSKISLRAITDRIELIGYNVELNLIEKITAARESITRPERLGNAAAPRRRSAALGSAHL